MLVDVFTTFDVSHISMSRRDHAFRNRPAPDRLAGRNLLGAWPLLYRYLLVVRFALLNVVALALLVAAYIQGWLDAVIDAPLRELSVSRQPA